MVSGSIECSQARVDMTDSHAARRSEWESVERLGSVIMRPWMYSMICFFGGVSDDHVETVWERDVRRKQFR